MQNAQAWITPAITPMPAFTA